MTLREIINHLLHIKCNLYPDLTTPEIHALENAATVLMAFAQALEGVHK